MHWLLSSGFAGWLRKPGWLGSSLDPSLKQLVLLLQVAVVSLLQKPRRILQVQGKDWKLLGFLMALEKLLVFSVLKGNVKNTFTVLTQKMDSETRSTAKVRVEFRSCKVWCQRSGTARAATVSILSLECGPLPSVAHWLSTTGLQSPRTQSHYFLIRCASLLPPNVCISPQTC